MERSPRGSACSARMTRAELALPRVVRPYDAAARLAIKRRHGCAARACTSRWWGRAVRACCSVDSTRRCALGRRGAIQVLRSSHAATRLSIRPIRFGRVPWSVRDSWRTHAAAKIARAHARAARRPTGAARCPTGPSTVQRRAVKRDAPRRAERHWRDATGVAAAAGSHLEPPRQARTIQRTATPHRRRTAALRISTCSTALHGCAACASIRRAP